MSEMLNNDQIAALVDAAKKGQLPEQTASAGNRRGPRLRTVDFSRPTKFTSDHQRTDRPRDRRVLPDGRHPALGGAALHDRARDDQHVPADLVGGPGTARAGLAARGARRAADRHADAADDRAAVRADVPGRAARRRAGPPAAGAPVQRDRLDAHGPPVRLDRPAVVGRLGGPRGRHAGTRRDRDPQRGQPDRVGLRADVRGDDREQDQQAFGSFCAAHPVGGDRAGQREHLRPQRAREEEESGDAGEIERAMAGVPVTLRAEVAATRLPIEDILALGPGSVIRLGARAEHGVSLFAENVKLAQAQPGSNGPRRAVQICGTEGRTVMSQNDITPREALTRLGASTAEAIAQVLESFTPGAVERGEVSVLAEGTTPFANVPRGAVAASVSYIDGVTGANIFVLTPTGARKLAGADGRPRRARRRGRTAASEFELSAIAEAANQMMAAAAAAIGVVLGQPIGISPPDTRVLDDPTKADELYGTAPYATLDDVLDRRRVVPADPARAQRVRRADGPRDGRAERRAARRDADGAPAATARRPWTPAQRRQRQSPGRARRHHPARVGRARARARCRSARRCRCRWERSSTSTAAPTPRSTCSSTACASPRATSCSPTTANGPIQI